VLLLSQWNVPVAAAIPAQSALVPRAGIEPWHIVASFNQAGGFFQGKWDEWEKAAMNGM